jgi:hypothetical protein
VFGEKSWPVVLGATASLGVVSSILAVGALAGHHEGAVGGYAKCGAEYFSFPAEDGAPETWDNALRMEHRLTLEERYTPDEIMMASADDPDLEKAAVENGQYVYECLEMLQSLSDEDDWEFKEDYFMD